jgi:hypothetical protein
MSKRKKRPLERVRGVVRDANLIVIASEDRYAVKQYFDFFRSTRVQVHVLSTEDGKSSPEHVLSRLDTFIEENDIGDGDEFWLVCDTDHWTQKGHIANLTLVQQLCRQKGIRFVVCNPCFELWLLLHFDDFPTGESVPSCDAIGDSIRTAIDGYNKRKVYNLPIGRLQVEAAVQRGKQQPHPLKQIPDSPQTSIHLIVDAILKRGDVNFVTTD